MTDEKREIQVGDKIGFQRVVAVAEAGYYVAPLSTYNGQPLYDRAKFVKK
jgi:hypothetical protein